LNTKNAIKANVRQTEAINKTEWNQANAYAKGLNRDAKRTMDNARLNFAADSALAIAGGYAAGLKNADTTTKVIKGVQVAKGAQHLRSSVNVKRGPLDTESRRGRPVKYKGYKNIHKKSRYSYGSYKAKGWTHGESAAHILLIVRCIKYHLQGLILLVLQMYLTRCLQLQMCLKH